MSDREDAHLLAADAPTLRPGYVGDILTRARWVRRRRQVTAWSAGLGALAVTVVGGTVVAQSVTDPPHIALPRPSWETGQQTTQPSGAPSAPIQPRSSRALAEEVREGGPRWQVLYVLDHTCANVITLHQGTCDPQPLPAPLRRDLTAALATYAPVEFVANGMDVTDVGEGLVVVNGGVVVTLGRMHLDRDQVEVALSVRHNGLNGRGVTYRLNRQSGDWRVQGMVGTGWIS